MSAQPARHLKVVEVDADGEFQYLDEHPELQGLRDEIKGLERDVRTWIRRYEELKRDKDQEARDHQLWPVAMIVWHAWEQKTGRKRRMELSPERFWLIEPFLRKRDKYGAGMCLRAVAGRVYDHYSTQRKNGSIKRYWEWDRIFKTCDEMEESASRAPKGWRDDPVFIDAVARLKGLAQ